MIALNHSPVAATVWFYPSPKDPPLQPAAKRSDTEAAADRLRLLIVEDEILVAIDIRSILEANNYAVVGIAATAEQAILTAERERPDLVLLDVRLEGQRDGVYAATEIRRRFDIPSLFITANADAAVRERARAAEPIGFLVKPFTEFALLRALSSAAI